MIANKMNALLQEPGRSPQQPELLVSAVLHLMSHYALKPQGSEVCVNLAAVIERHLKALAILPDLTPVLRATCQQLSEQWTAMIEHVTPVKEKLTLFSRLMQVSRSR